MDRKMSEQILNIEFVKEVENFPCIYDYRREDYARKDVIDQAWATIGKKFNLSGPQCRERWKNLRTVLSRNLKPCENGKSRSSKQQRKPYYLFEAMKFAVPFIKSHNSVPPNFKKKETNSASEPDEKSEENEEIEVEMPEVICQVKVETKYEQSRSPSPYASPPPSPQVSLLEAPSPISLTPPPQSRDLRKRKPKTQYNDAAEVETDENVSKNVKSKKSKSKVKPDLTKISKKRFLLSLLSDVYSMDNAQMRTFRIKVLNVINDITQTPSSLECKCHAATSNQGSRQSVQTLTSNGDPGNEGQTRTYNGGPGKVLQNMTPNEGPGPSQQRPVPNTPSEQIYQNLNSAYPRIESVVVKIEKED